MLGVSLVDQSVSGLVDLVDSIVLIAELFQEILEFPLEDFDVLQIHSHVLSCYVGFLKWTFSSEHFSKYAIFHDYLDSSSFIASRKAKFLYF